MEPILEVGDAAALATALLALLATVAQSRHARTHNELSVQPLLAIYHSMDTTRGLGVFIENHGFGPAIIEKTELSLGRDHPWCDVSTEAGLRSFVLSMLNGLDARYHFHFQAPGESISANYQWHIFTIRDGNVVTEHAEELKNRISGLRVRVEYKSLYKKKFKKESLGFERPTGSIPAQPQDDSEPDAHTAVSSSNPNAPESSEA